MITFSETHMHFMFCNYFNPHVPKTLKVRVGVTKNVFHYPSLNIWPLKVKMPKNNEYPWKYQAKKDTYSRVGKAVIYYCAHVRCALAIKISTMPWCQTKHPKIFQVMDCKVEIRLLQCVVYLWTNLTHKLMFLSKIYEFIILLIKCRGAPKKNNKAQKIQKII